MMDLGWLLPELTLVVLGTWRRLLQEPQRETLFALPSAIKPATGDSVVPVISLLEKCPRLLKPSQYQIVTNTAVLRLRMGSWKWLGGQIPVGHTQLPWVFISNVKWVAGRIGPSALWLSASSFECTS